MSEATERARAFAVEVNELIAEGVENNTLVLPNKELLLIGELILRTLAALDLIEAQDATIINCSVKIGPNHLSRLRHAKRKFEEAVGGGSS